MKQNPWRDCRSDPPKQYQRVEIRDKYNNRYIGYRYLSDYYETFGNYLIKNPMLWRYPPKGSKLVAELKEKIHTMFGGEPVYDITREQMCGL